MTGFNSKRKMSKDRFNSISRYDADWYDQVAIVRAVVSLILVVLVITLFI